MNPKMGGQCGLKKNISRFHESVPNVPEQKSSFQITYFSNNQNLFETHKLSPSVH